MERKMTEPLNPCPFCGDKEPSYVDGLEEGTVKAGNPNRWFVGCESCGARTRHCRNHDSAARFWNRGLSKPLSNAEGPDSQLGTQWRHINTLPDSDDLIWLRKGNSYEGPRPPSPFDTDEFDEWAPCEPPN
jgi:hypothetical protein